METTACSAISDAPGHLRPFSRRAQAFNMAWVMPTRERDTKGVQSVSVQRFLNILIFVFVWATKSGFASSRWKFYEYFGGT